MRTVNENEMRAVSAGRPAKWVWVAGSSCSAYAKGGPIGTALMTYHRNVGCVVCKMGRGLMFGDILPKCKKDRII